MLRVGPRKRKHRIGKLVSLGRKSTRPAHATHVVLRNTSASNRFNHSESSNMLSSSVCIVVHRAAFAEGSIAESGTDREPRPKEVRMEMA